MSYRAAVMAGLPPSTMTIVDTKLRPWPAVYAAGSLLESVSVLPTRREAAALLEDRGFPAEAAELLLSQTAPHRHFRRAVGTLAAAERWVRTHLYHEVEYHDAEIDASWDMLSILHEDLVGYGGTGGLTGASTARHPAFAGCGKGRKQASDGAAWDAAATTALWAITAHIRRWEGSAYRVGLAAYALPDGSTHCAYVCFDDTASPRPDGLPPWQGMGGEVCWAVRRLAFLAAAGTYPAGINPAMNGFEVAGGPEFWAATL